MTAEIAILNKTAVALAADSAVTISIGANQQKVYDSEDKLFELCSDDPIGIMINNGMHFMEAPLPVLIKQYRRECPRFKKVEGAALSFLKHLRGFGAKASEGVEGRSIRHAVRPVFEIVRKRTNEKFQERLFNIDPNEDRSSPDYFVNLREKVLSEQIAAMSKAIDGLEPTESIGRKRAAPLLETVINELTSELFTEANAAQILALRNLAGSTLTHRVRWSPHTGVVFAGFGGDELFPTLISFELYGMIQGQLRFYRTNDVDIRRSGTRAKVIPFAQKEMVERFLYGLDDEIERKISDFCKQSIPKIREVTLNALDMPPEDRDAIETDMVAAEEAFLAGLQEETFETIRKQSQDEIEDMVEFMPKPEMGQMAEALVNLTSIKRRVSRGMETVGGPIDCAVISKAEGFVWVKRKHYFASELNARYFERNRQRSRIEEEA